MNMTKEIKETKKTAFSKKKTSFKLDEKTFQRLRQFAALLVFFLIWQLFSDWNQSKELFNPRFLPSVTQVLGTTVDGIRSGVLTSAILASLGRVFAGFLLGTLVGVVLGVIMSSVKLINDIISPILNLLGPIPVYAFLPIFMIWFGISEQSKVLLIAYATFLPVLTYTVDGIKNVNPVWIRSVRSLGATNFQVYKEVLIKAALPNVFVGMKISLALAFGALIVAEMMGASNGLGFIIVNARNWFNLDDMFMACIIIGLLYSFFTWVLTTIERLLFKWKRDGVHSAIEK
ncbi:ABC transporter permease [Enterococcus olivae]